MNAFPIHPVNSAANASISIPVKARTSFLHSNPLNSVNRTKTRYVTMSAMSTTTSGPAGCSRKALLKSPENKDITERVIPQPGQSTPSTDLKTQTLSPLT